MYEPNPAAGRVLFDYENQSISSTSGAWADLPGVEEVLINPFAWIFLGGVCEGSDLEFRVVQGVKRTNGTIKWLIPSDPCELTAAATLNNGQEVKVGMDWAKIQVKCSGAVTGAYLYVTARAKS